MTDNVGITRLKDVNIDLILGKSAKFQMAETVMSCEDISNEQKIKEIMEIIKS